MAVGLVMTGLATVMFSATEADLGRTVAVTSRTGAFHAAEAGIDDYVAKLTEDHLYYAHFVHPAESTRRPPSGSDVAADNPWPHPPEWTYPTPKNAWKTLNNGYEFNIEVAPPESGSPAVHIRSTGRRTGSTSGARTLETLVRPASVADFFMITNKDYSAGPSATTRGPVYSAGNVKHEGQAYANVMAEGQITTSPTYHDGAQGYDSDSTPDIRSVVNNPINFSSFTGSLVDISRAAQNSGGIYLNSAVDGFRLTFNSGGTITIETCMKAGSSPKHLAKTAPTCTPFIASVPVPSIGAIYAAQSVIVRGQVKGRVTIASNVDIIVGNNLTYVQPGTDVLGLIATNDVIVAKWITDNPLNWRSSVIARTGSRRSWDSCGCKGTLNFTGSTASNLSPYMDMFSTRNYNYDTNLAFLQPPYFPVLEEAYSVLFFREINP